MNKICKTSLIVFVLVFLISILGVNSVYAWSDNEFHTLGGIDITRTTENMSTDDFNIRYLKVPTGTIVTNAYLNLTGYVFGYGTYNTSWLLSPKFSYGFDLATNGTYIYLSSTGNVSIWNKNGVYIGNFTLNSSMGSPTGIATNGTYIWSYDYTGNYIYQYNMTGGNIRRFTLSDGLTSGYGLTTNGTSFWLVQDLGSGDSFREYDMNGIFKRAFNEDIQDNFQGIEYYNNTLYCSVSDDTVLHKYAMDGTYLGNVSLNVSNTNAGGLTIDGRNIYILSKGAPGSERVFSYNFGTYPSDVSMDVGEYGSWTNYFIGGTFSSTNRTFNLANWVNIYTTACDCTDCEILTGYCGVPFEFQTDINGILNYNNLRFDNIGFLEISQNYTNSVYESSTERILINITYDNNFYTSSSASLVYNGTSYAGTKQGTGSNISFYKDLTIQSPLGNKNFYWNISLTNSSGTYYFNSTSHTQTVNSIQLGLCNSTLNIPYINITFADESDSTSLNASVDLATFTYWIGDGSSTKTFIFQNTTENRMYSFCFSPSNEPITVDLSFKYSATGYPIRTFTYDNQALTNTSTLKTLYMLGSADGIYSAIRTADTSGSAISGVTIQYERQIGGLWTLLGQEVTGSDGVATLWLNPNYEYRLTATKTGYSSVQVTITPSQTQYTITMNSGADSGGFISDTTGIKWYVYPGSGTLNATTSQNFNATVTSSLANLENCKFELYNGNNLSEVLSSVTGITNSSYCYISLTYTTLKDQKIFGRLSIDTTNTTGFVIVDADNAWVVFDFSNKKPWNTITSFFSELRGLSEFGQGNEAEFNRIVFFFLVTTIFIGVFIFFSGIEMSNPGLCLIIIWGIILIASIGGFLTYNSGSLAYGTTELDATGQSIPDRFGFFFLFTMLIVGYILSMIRRTGE